MRLLTSATAVLAIPGASAQLNKLAKAAGKLYFGSATDNGELSDTAYVAILEDTDEFGQITPGNGQKWQYTEPSQGQFSYTSGDEIVDFAATNGQIVRCHTLVWYSQLPSWVSSGSWTTDQMTSIINTHIANEVGHYKGQCYSWDVVNEALNEDGTYRSNIFYTVLGESYIPLAFEAAAAADPDAKLYYNDYNIEATGTKQAAAVNIITLVKDAGAKIDGVGMQAHLIVGSVSAQSALESAMNSYLAAGVTEVSYTELDIRFSSLPATDAGLQQQATDYATVTQACLAVDACVGITIWDYTDKYSWIPSTFDGQGAALLYDDNLSKKPAWTAVSSVLAAAAATAGTSASASASATTTTAQTAVTTTLATSTKAAASTTTTAAATTTSATGSCTVAKWGQCAGKGFTGCTTCASGSTCKFSNDYYSQCL
ncbi:carbohydrate-binding module family 1 protein [Biscogniauxia mediterranea]|nr:carbohydrate-binding module family 1 protein [Biscogniauxia mediterranea]